MQTMYSGLIEQIWADSWKPSKDQKLTWLNVLVAKYRRKDVGYVDEVWHVNKGIVIKSRTEI